MSSLLTIFLNIDHERVAAFLPELQDFLLSKGLVNGLDYELQSGPVADGLPKKSLPPSDEPSPKQMKLFKWKLGALYGLLHEARQIPDVDEVDIAFARDVLYVAQVEYDEHLAGQTPITKKRIHDLIDALLESHKDLEFSIAEA